MELSIELINQILGYLATKPYGEVYQLINNIQQEANDQQGRGNTEAENPGG